MRLAILGGSFNPIHLGHLFIADAALSGLGYDRVALVPAFRSPFKLSAQGMEESARSRMEMIAASIAGDPRLALDDCEIRRGGVSYTADTLADVIRRHAPDGKPGLIIGDDLAGDFPDWRRSGEILEMADVIIARRAHSGGAKAAFPCIQMENGAMDISSRMVREQIARNGAWRYLVPAPARAAIERQGLYGLAPGAGEPGGLSAAVGGAWPWGRHSADITIRAEEAVRESVSFERFLHSRSTALFAWDMCRRFSLDPAQGYLAGIAHDLAKNLCDREQIRLARRYDKKISHIEHEKPSLLHGKAAAALLRECFGLRSEAVLEAVAKHTLPGGNMGPLAKVVYIADKLEAGREKADPALRKLALSGSDLDEIFLEVLERSAASISSRMLKLSDETLGLLEKARARRRKQKDGEVL